MREKIRVNKSGKIEADFNKARHFDPLRHLLFISSDQLSAFCLFFFTINLSSPRFPENTSNASS